MWFVQNRVVTPTLRQGTDGFTCLIMGTDRMCADKNSMEFIHAMMSQITSMALTFGGVMFALQNSYRKWSYQNMHTLALFPSSMAFSFIIGLVR